MTKIGIGERMKANYEEIWKYKLPMRLPVILRLDGKCFHEFTRKIERPFDRKFIDNMAKLATYLCEKIHTSQLAYLQSDEISILLHPYKKLDTQAWFGNEIQKMVSIASGLASSWFSLRYKREAIFDCRCFLLPEAETVNYFIWRQQDATRNSIAMLAQSIFSPRQLHKKNVKQAQDMMMEKRVNWNDLDDWKKRGIVVRKYYGKWGRDYHIPVFTQNRNYIEKWLKVEKE